MPQEVLADFDMKERDTAQHPLSWGSFFLIASHVTTNISQS